MNMRVAAVDVGNTSIKVGTGVADRFAFQRFDTWEAALTHLRSLGVEAVIYASVASNSGQLEAQLRASGISTFCFGSHVPLPFRVDYTGLLGADRLAAAYWAWKRLEPEETALVILAGTCITYNVLDKAQWLDGAISPGLRMRLEAMHRFTGRLPLAPMPPPTTETDAPARSTIESLQKGAWDGAVGEVEFFIRRWRTRYAPLTVFISGGDAPYICRRIWGAQCVVEAVLQGLLEFAHDYEMA